MLNLSYNSNGFLNRSLDETIDVLKNIGYKAIEISLDRNHLDPTYHSDAYVETLKRKLGRGDFKIVSFHTGGKNILSEVDFEPSLVSDTKKARQKRISFIIEGINLARELGVNMVTITSGIARDSVDNKKAKKYLHESINQILKHTGGIDLLFENEIGMYISTTNDLIELCDHYSGSLWATFDIGHAYCLNEDICDSIDSLGSRIKHMHFEDIMGGVHRHLIPGEGEIDFDAIVKKVAHNTYEGFCSVELYTYNHIPETAAQRSYAYLTAFMNAPALRNTAP